MSRNHPHNHPYHYQIVIYFISKWYIWLVFQNISTIQLLMHYASCHVWGDVFSYSFLTYIFCTKILFAYLCVSTFEPMNPKNCVNLNILPNENIKTIWFLDPFRISWAPCKSPKRPSKNMIEELRMPPYPSTNTVKRRVKSNRYTTSVKTCYCVIL